MFPLSFPTATSAVSYALYPFDKVAFQAKIGYWLERRYGVVTDSNGIVTSWTCRYTGKVATPYTSGPYVSQDGSLRGYGENDLQIPFSSSLASTGASGTGMQIFARVKSAQTGATKAIAGHWDGGAPIDGTDDWILAINCLADNTKGAFIVYENTTAAKETRTSGKVTNGVYTTLEGVWSGNGTNISAYNDGMIGTPTAVGIAGVNTSKTNPILLWRYAPTGAALSGFCSADLAAIIHFTSPLTTNEAHYVRSYLMGLN